jgi:hypothetical protein
MRRERYKGHIVVARLLKVRTLPIWHASVFLDRLVNGTWLEIPVEPGLAGQEFSTEDSALAAALGHGRRYVDRLHISHRFIDPDSKTLEISFPAISE